MNLLGRGHPMDERTKALQQRTKQFALRIIRLVRTLPNSPEGWVIGKQILRSGTAIGANYRAACVARSRVEFVARIGVVLEESDETIYWLELLGEANTVRPKLLEELIKECSELSRIFGASRRTAKEKE
jgi:four helix bundle protein